MDKLSLTGLRVDCIVGVHPGERHKPQPLGVSLALRFDTRPAAYDSKLRDTVDYVRLWGEVRFLLHASRFLLLESAAEAIARWVLAPPSDDAPRAHVDSVTVKLEKPHALGGGGIPSIEIERNANSLNLQAYERPYGRLEQIFATKGCSIHRVRLASGQSIGAHEHRQMEESELVLGDGLLLQGEPVVAGTARRWPRGFVHRYDNPSSTEQSVLCVARPSLIVEDEIPATAAFANAASGREVDVTCFFP